MSVKIMDCVELTVEKECYAKEGVHKRMQGWSLRPPDDRSVMVGGLPAMRREKRYCNSAG